MRLGHCLGCATSPETARVPELAPTRRVTFCGDLGGGGNLGGGAFKPSARRAGRPRSAATRTPSDALEWDGEWNAGCGLCARGGVDDAQAGADDARTAGVQPARSLKNARRVSDPKTTPRSVRAALLRRVSAWTTAAARCAAPSHLIAQSRKCLRRSDSYLAASCHACQAERSARRAAPAPRCRRASDTTAKRRCSVRCRAAEPARSAKCRAAEPARSTDRASSHLLADSRANFLCVASRRTAPTQSAHAFCLSALIVEPAKVKRRHFAMASWTLLKVFLCSFAAATSLLRERWATRIAASAARLIRWSSRRAAS
mmetsp:Transcript_13145/g.43897  ORF Transcript_13145/g.43897 Transcript_13145/m.43897 type:complete len:315 (+) Transcript_13145:32-976(+)